MKRREFVGGAMGAAAIFTLGRPAQSESATEFRIGYQKNGVFVVARQQGILEKRLGADGVKLKWIEFSSGPPMLEAMNVGSIDLGQVGDTPPIFAQAAGAALVYAAGQPITNGQGILVRPASRIRRLADLKGARIGFTKGSSAHNVTVIALEKAGLAYGDIVPIYLTPPDAAAAFTRGSIDAWAVWDPYFAIGEKQGGRILVQANELAKTNSFYIANRDFAQRQPKLLRTVIDLLAETAVWAENNRDQVAKAMAEVTGVDLVIQKIAVDRSSFAIGRLTGEIIATQQAVADRFFKLGLIPKRIRIDEAIWPSARA